MEQMEQFQSDRLVIHRGYDNHLTLYPEVVWDEKRRKIAQYNPDKKDERAAIRYFHRGASYLKIDNSGRILLPKKLIDWASLKKDVVLFAYEGQVEVWDKAKYDEDVLSEPDNFGQITDQIHQGQNEKEQ